MRIQLKKILDKKTKRFLASSPIMSDPQQSSEAI
jgi:hypothetical protein